MTADTTPETDIQIATEPDARVPRVAALARPVADLVHACHEKTIDGGLAALGAPDFDRGALERILTYCAELRCEGDTATCPGCKRRTEAQGLATLDDYIAHHKEIVVGDGTVRLRRARHGNSPHARDGRSRKDMVGRELLVLGAPPVAKAAAWHSPGEHFQRSPVAGPGETPSVILVEPQLADNIGMVARAMANFGLDDLRLVAPRDGWPNEKARIAASGANYIIDDAAAYPSLEASARRRQLRRRHHGTPASAEKAGADA